MFGDDAPLFDRPLAPIEMDIAKRLTAPSPAAAGTATSTTRRRPSAPPAQRITTPASGCAGRRCAYSAQCAVLRSRNTVRDAQIVVTNHALLLSALSIGDSDNGQPLIAPPSDMLLVLDEGHHIGNVAIDQGAASLALDEMAKRTGRLQILIAGAYRAVDKDRSATCCRTKRSRWPATWPSSCARSAIISSGVDAGAGGRRADVARGQWAPARGLARADRGAG
jgi:ATP-dependent DNA helicase DinG